MPDLGALAFAAAIGFLGLSRGLRHRKGRVQQVHLRGRSLKTPTAAAELLAKAKSPADSGLQIGQHLFPSEIATRHFAFIGTTGAGKTLLQRLLMQSALSKIGTGLGRRAVIYDAKQDILSILAGMGIHCPIHILNTLDARSIA